MFRVSYSGHTSQPGSKIVQSGQGDGKELRINDLDDWTRGHSRKWLISLIFLRLAHQSGQLSQLAHKFSR
jgi:hypothetical protein